MAAIPDVHKRIDAKFKTLKLLEKDTPRIYERSELNKQKLLHEKRSDEINDVKMETLKAMIGNNSEKEIEQ